MADPLPPYPDIEDENEVGRDSGSAAGTPRWVSVLGVIVAIGLVLLFVFLHLSGTVGPGAH